MDVDGAVLMYTSHMLILRWTLLLPQEQIIKLKESLSSVSQEIAKLDELVLTEYFAVRGILMT